MNNLHVIQMGMFISISNDQMYSDIYREIIYDSLVCLIYFIYDESSWTRCNNGRNVVRIATYY